MASLPVAAQHPHHSQEPRSGALEHYLTQLAIWPDAIPAQVEHHLINVYFDNANRRWPFLLRATFESWHACWKKRSSDRDRPERERDLWQGFFVNMSFYEQAVNNYLPAVLRQPNRLLHVQAYLMMSIHALFSPSTEQISLMISSAVRYCIVARFHLVEAEPEPVDAASRLEIQMRRRAFWAAYSLDRLACGVLRLPFSIADDNITVPLFENIDDSALLDGSFVSQGSSAKTSVSSALHRERCFQIQSEILNVTMRADFAMNFDSLSDWRSYILAKLDHWRSQLSHFSDSDTKTPMHERWILIVYNHCLLYLHIPTKSNVRGPAGDWSVQASTQSILIFRKYQGYGTIPHPMLGLISQFSIGTIILYCLWATPPKFRTESYNSKNVIEAIRACSNNLAIITERWENTKDLSDIFELLATEIPLAESVSPTPTNPPLPNMNMNIHSNMHNHNNIHTLDNIHNNNIHTTTRTRTTYGESERAIKRISDEAARELRAKLPRVKSLVLNREIIRMIEEMMTEDFPRDHDYDAPGPTATQANTGTLDPSSSSYPSSGMGVGIGGGGGGAGGEGDKLDHDHLSATATATLPMSTHPFFVHPHTLPLPSPLHHFPSPYLSADGSAGQLGAMSPGQTLEFPGSLSGYDMF
ncbi:hypothetical protein A1O3_09826 [Capronia epimyces CBS 606.96]|uniref:Xylanolytic transcriptional activator regulatory domain-containing protein n=1 Tax=Capronia epimyces CBS 606.96 TaxID=1182542 RepID=W9Y564_9EURO|nr:uncharacterized protein A1O3_09826 [Capronia epimyces CBS 606.96]EXJ77599.1 hypothetical protein A1O3_09826 [Capronia epimyces CBS 606.96]